MSRCYYYIMKGGIILYEVHVILCIGKVFVNLKIFLSIDEKKTKLHQ